MIEQSNNLFTMNDLPKGPDGKPWRILRPRCKVIIAGLIGLPACLEIGAI